MSTNNVRRHQTAEQQVVNLAERRTARATTLAAIRDRLAVTIVERESHDLDANDLYGDLAELESAIKVIAPQLYADRWVAWVEQDTELAHDADSPRDDCALCTLLQSYRTA